MLCEPAIKTVFRVLGIYRCKEVARVVVSDHFQNRVRISDLVRFGSVWFALWADALQII